MLAALKLFSKDEEVRAGAIKTLAGESDEARLPLIEKAYAAESVPALKSQLEQMRAAILLSSSDLAKRLEAAALLSSSNNPNTKTVLIERLDTETDADVKVALQSALTKLYPNDFRDCHGAVRWRRAGAGDAGSGAGGERVIEVYLGR